MNTGSGEEAWDRPGATVELPSERASVVVTRLPSGKHGIRVSGNDPALFVPSSYWETAYPLELIRRVLQLKGPAWLCDEIERDESPSYTGAALQWAILSYVDERELDGKRILDFGCGPGASTVALCRMFPSAEVVGVDLDRPSLEVAEARAEYYGLSNVRFLDSSQGTSVPPALGRFHHILMSGVFEHLLPQERTSLLPQLWALLEPGGILFLRETPHRYFPIETHTLGLPFINYLPDKWTLLAARTFARSRAGTESWEGLLRRGIRGGTIREIRRILERSGNGVPELLEPTRLGIEDRIDLWYRTSAKSKYGAARRAIRVLCKLLKRTTRIELVPYLELAIRKADRSAQG